MTNTLLKLAKKHTFVVLTTIIALLSLWIYFIKQEYLKMNALAEKEIKFKIEQTEKIAKLKIDSIVNAVQIKLEHSKLAQEKAKYEKLQQAYQIKMSDLHAKSIEMNKKSDSIDEKMRFVNLIESLRKDYNQISASFINNDENYMKTYREYQATHALAVVLAKKLHVYEDYEEFLSQR